MTRNKLWMALALLAAAGWAQAVPETQFEPAFEQFMQASDGHAAPAAAVQAFAVLQGQEPANPVLLAYLGAATTLQARDTWLPWKKMGYADEGLALLDKALALLGSRHDAPLQHGTPAVLEVKFVAANSFLAVPGFMNRHERGRKLLAEVLASPLLAQAPLGFRGSAWLAGAQEAARSKDGARQRALLQQVIDAGAPQAAQARALLAGASR